uniref:Uncharacterized protein n=1 Tax=Solanum lycopersicum TaxID=4081 RepID=A0A3Q7IVP6_SOLLC
MSPTHPFYLCSLKMVNDSLKNPKTLSKLATTPVVGIWGYCDEPNCIAYDSSGFKRELYLRKYYSIMDAYYFTFSLEKFRSFTIVGTFLHQNPNVEDTIPSTALLANSNMKV